MKALKQRPNPSLLSLVIPCYNESEALESLACALEKFAHELEVPLEVILIDDGSQDDTWHQVSEWKPKNYSLKSFSLSRNFGHQLAVTAGLDRAKGDAVVIMDADLQDPPEVIHRMIKAYCLEYDVVHGKRLNRDGETLFKKYSAWAFYRIMKCAGASHLALDSGDFRLVSRRCLDQVIKMKEQNRFLVGFPGIWSCWDRNLSLNKRNDSVIPSQEFPFASDMCFRVYHPCGTDGNTFWTASFYHHSFKWRPGI